MHILHMKYITLQPLLLRQSWGYDIIYTRVAFVRSCICKCDVKALEIINASHQYLVFQSHCMFLNHIICFLSFHHVDTGQHCRLTICKGFDWTTVDYTSYMFWELIQRQVETTILCWPWKHFPEKRTSQSRLRSSRPPSRAARSKAWGKNDKTRKRQLLCNFQRRGPHWDRRLSKRED